MSLVLAKGDCIEVDTTSSFPPYIRLHSHEVGGSVVYLLLCNIMSCIVILRACVHSFMYSVKDMFAEIKHIAGPARPVRFWPYHFLVA